MTTTRQSKAKIQSEKAAGLERSHRWGQAASAWRMAKSLFQKAPTGHDNIKWCDNRADHCSTMAEYEDDDY